MTITRRGALTGITMRGGPGTTVRFAVDWVRVETVITPGDTEEQTIDDAVFEVSTPATVDYEAQAIIRPTHPDADVSQITWSTSDPSIATIDASGRVTRVSDGYIRIIATDQHGATAKSGLVHIYRQSGVESQTFVRWVEGSLAKAAADAIDNRIADADPQADMAIFTTQDHANGIYVRNPDCWAADLDLTGVSPWNSRSGALRAGVAISPRDVLTSEHYPLQVGDTIRFVAADNTVVTRTIAAVENVGPANSSDGYATDFQVCTLSEDLPAEIKYYSVLPAEWADYIRNLNIGLPTLGLDQQEKALVQDLHSLGAFAVHRVPSDSQRLAFYESKITGDSGNPSLLILDDEPVLVTLWTFGGAGSGPNIARLHDLINAAMTANGSPYQLTVADLSGWTNFADPIGAMIADYASAGMEHLYLFNTTPAANATIADHIGGGVGSRPGTLIAAWDGSLPEGGRTRPGQVLTGMYFNESTTRPNNTDLGHNVYFGVTATGWPLTSPTSALTIIVWATYYNQLNGNPLFDYRGQDAGASFNGVAMSTQRAELCDGTTLWATTAQTLPSAGTFAMYAMTWSLASQSLRFFVNGSLVASTTTAASGPITLRNGRLFHRQVPGYAWPRLDAWLVATADVALSDATIAALYERGLA